MTARRMSRISTPGATSRMTSSPLTEVIVPYMPAVVRTCWPGRSSRWACMTRRCRLRCGLIITKYITPKIAMMTSRKRRLLLPDEDLVLVAARIVFPIPGRPSR
jgi:hypothetical protein